MEIIFDKKKDFHQKVSQLFTIHYYDCKVSNSRVLRNIVSPIVF